MNYSPSLSENDQFAYAKSSRKVLICSSIHVYLKGKMHIKIVYLGLARSRIGKKDEQYEVVDGSTLADLLEVLIKNYGERLQSIIRSGRENRLDPTFVTTVDGVLKDPLRGNDVTLNDGDTITLMTMISGG
jgi:molybdopterin converting factor small subunit